jgi:hypothetical protein
VAAVASRAAGLHDLLPERDPIDFGISGPDTRPAHTAVFQPRTWGVVEADLGYRNAWTLSASAQQYFGSFAVSRPHVDAAALAAMEAQPSDKYLAGTQLSALDVSLQYRFSSVWSGYLIASALSYQSGYLDGSFETVQSAFGMESFGRPAVGRNDINYAFPFRADTAPSVAAPARTGITDTTIGFRYTGIRMPHSWQLVVEGAAKIPLRSYDPLFSTGRGDYGPEVSLQHLGDKQGVYLNFAAVHYAGVPGPIPRDSQTLPTWILGYERAVAVRTSVIVQGYMSNSLYSRDQTEPEELTARKYLLSLGLRHRRGHSLYTFAVTEHLKNLDNTPDLSFQLGLFYVP